MKRLSIKARVTFWYTLLVALIALLAAGALFWSAQRMMDNYYEEALVGTTQLALNDVRMEDGQLEIDRNLDDLPSVRVSLYTQSGDLIYGKWRFDLPFEENVIRPATERSGERWYVLDTRMSFPDAEDIWLRCYISADAAANLNDMSATLLHGAAAGAGGGRRRGRVLHRPPRLPAGHAHRAHGGEHHRRKRSAKAHRPAGRARRTLPALQGVRRHA